MAYLIDNVMCPNCKTLHDFVAEEMTAGWTAYAFECPTTKAAGEIVFQKAGESVMSIPKDAVWASPKKTA
jgi:hypothetical protein